MNIVESHAAVTQLEAKKSPAETYQTFYDLYGEAALQRRGPSGWHVVLGRVLHFDLNDSGDVHVMVARSNESMNLPIRRRYSSLGLPMHEVPYRASDFMVASTDGQGIAVYGVRSVMGIYRNHINGVDKPYNPQYEKLQLRLESEQGASRAEFQYASGDGIFELHGYPAGWILSELESSRIQAGILQGIGHAAIAS